ncbi:MAG: 4'-phosphopantetheinyl transferase superfamily protein [Bdellovibrionota bacterium]|nr:MAG: 4'-phosphopantetheinyl transferase superfamily protein [Bdellovibrionota bacterium]
MSAGYEPLALPSPFPPDVVWIGERYAPVLPAHQREREQERANRLIALALETLGVRSAGPLPHAESGARSWPEGVVGSVSHTHTAVVVAAGPSAHYRTIGIDIERVDRELHPRIEERICRPEERQALTVLSHPEERRLRLLLTFCCKETLFKALSPLVRRYFGYQDARLEFEDDGKVRAGLVTDTLAPFKAGSTFPISTHIHGEYIYSGLALPALQ